MSNSKRGCLWWVGRLIGGFLLLTLLCLGTSTLYGSYASRRDREAYPPVGQMVPVGEHSLHLHCMGEGTPIVILDAGLGDWSLAWRAVQAELAADTQVCSYDRAGLGWSEPGPKPRSIEQITSELHTLLAKAQLSPAYVLVGHSAGGMYARVYADSYPEEVAGLVLIDAPDEQAELPPEREALEGQARVMALMSKLGLFYTIGLLAGDAEDAGGGFLPSYVAQLSAEDRERYLVTSLHSFDALADEWASAQTTLERLRQVEPLGEIPVAVLVARETLNASGKEVLAPSPNLPLTTSYLIVEESRHHIQADQPELVIQSIQEVVEAARRGQPLD